MSLFYNILWTQLSHFVFCLNLFSYEIKQSDHVISHLDLKVYNPVRTISQMLPLDLIC